jgi:hypothetical protein
VIVLTDVWACIDPLSGGRAVSRTTVHEIAPSPSRGGVAKIIATSYSRR